MQSKGLSRAFSSPQLSKPINSLTGGRAAPLGGGGRLGDSWSWVNKVLGQRRRRDRRKSLKNSY